MKCQLIDMETETCLMKSNAEKIYAPGTFMNVTFLPSKNKEHFELESATHSECLEVLLRTIFKSDECPVNGLDDIFNGERARREQDSHCSGCNGCWINFHRKYDIILLRNFEKVFPKRVIEKFYGPYSWEEDTRVTYSKHFAK